MKIIQWFIDNLTTLKTIIFYLFVYEVIKWAIKKIFNKIINKYKKDLI
jgi:hypothetical protein